MSVIGLDVGTSRVKAVRFDDSWNAVDVHGEINVVRRGSGGSREQDMPAVWSAVARVLETVVRRSPDRVTLVAVTAQGDGCWLVDSAGEPVGPALLWNDNRSAPIIDRWRRDGRLEAAFKVNGCQGAPGTAHAQLAWLTEHDPGTLRDADTLLSCGSWIYSQLTNRRVLETTEAANPFFDAAKRVYDHTLLDRFDLGHIERLLPEVVSGADRAAPILPSVADQLGLDTQTLVTLAPYDVPATAIGTGVVEPDLAFAVLGTTLCVGTVATDPRLDRPANGMTLPGTDDDTWLIAYATMIGTEVLDWVATLLGLGDAAAVVTLAATSRRPDLPVVLPYLSAAGERSPFLDTTVRGTISGLDSGHVPADIARATVDALSLVIKDCLNAAGTADRLALSGGGAASAPWCQSISDAVGIPVLSPDVGEVGARGAVVSGAVDVDMFPDHPSAIAAAVHPGRTYEPRPEQVERFEHGYERFLDLRRQLTERPQDNV